MNWRTCHTPWMVIEWNFAGFETAWMCLETSERERPVKPPSVQASRIILRRISGGRFSNCIGD